MSAEAGRRLSRRVEHDVVAVSSAGRGRSATGRHGGQIRVWALLAGGMPAV